MPFSRPGGGLIRCPEHRKFALQADVRPLHQGIHLGEHGDPDHHQGALNAGLPQAPELFQAGGPNAVQPRRVVDFGRLRVGAESLYNPGKADRRSLAAPLKRCQVFFQLSEIHLHLGIL